MARTPSSEIPPRLELQCLKALWILGEANVKDVRQALLTDRKLAYTTVMTVLDRLTRRGGVKRRKAGRSFVYTPVLTRELLRRVAVKELVDGFFDGSQESLVEYLGDTVFHPSANGAAVLATAEVSAHHTNLDASLL